MDKEIEEKKQNAGELNDIETAAIGSVSAETVQRYGSAAKEHYVAYSGIDNENEIKLVKGLKQIAESKADINSPYYKTNIKQQAGFSAEVKSVARSNAERIIKGDRTRAIRTDDIGRINDPLHDIVDIDPDGRIIPGSEKQLKFVGKDPDDLLDKSMGKKWQKYIDDDGGLGVADDDYSALIGDAGDIGIIDNRIQLLSNQYERLKNKGDLVTAEKKLYQISKLKRIKSKLKKTGLTREESIEARLNPEMSTAKDVARISNSAGLQGAKYGALLSGSISIARNMTAYIQGEISADEAAKNVVMDTGVGTVTGYTTAFLSTPLKGAMQNSSINMIKELSKTNLATCLVTTTVDVGKTIHKYFKGDIDEEHFIRQLGENGFSELGSFLGSSMGVAVTAGSARLIAALGGLTGGILGYLIAKGIYNEIIANLDRKELEHQERLRIIEEAEKAAEEARRYRSELERYLEDYFRDYKTCFDEALSELDIALKSGDADGAILGANKITQKLGGEVHFETVEEFGTYFDETDIDYL